ncbi:MAG: membrane protein insertase YidC, partial [Gemmatimonadota bacterium]|nr:membrane protein insertase YidC [Gemmatimonadota bacterium]
MMEKKSAMAMMLIFMLWMGYFMFFAPKPKPRQQQQTAGESLDSAGPRAEAAPTAPSGEQLVFDEPAKGIIPGEGAVDTKIVAPDTVVVSSDLYEYHFITRGGVMTRAWLKEYPSFSDRKSKADTSRVGGPVQLIPEQESLFLYSRLHLKNMDKPIDLGSRSFTASTMNLRLGSARGENQEGSVTFIHNLTDGSELRLVYSFRADSYLIDAELHLPSQLHGPGENRVEVMLGPTIVSNEKNSKEDYRNYGVVYYDDGEVVDKSLGDLTESDWAPSGEHSILWGGLKSMYFISTFFVPDAPMVGLSASGDEESNDLCFN